MAKLQSDKLTRQEDEPSVQVRISQKWHEFLKLTAIREKKTMRQLLDDLLESCYS